MINYVLCHIGQLPPPYLLDSFRSIKNVDPDARIFFITDQDVEIESIEVLQVLDISSDQTLQVMDMRLFEKDPNPLWRTSIFRIFLVRDSLKYLNLESCYHFDSDVLMFQSSNMFDSLINNSDGLSITYHTDNELVFGFSNFGDIKKIDEICNILFDIVFDTSKQAEYSSNMPNEMQLLYGIYKRRPDLIKKLEIIPNYSKVVFDPSSYGQFFGGTHNNHGPGWYGNHHVIGRQIGQGVLKPIMINKKPYVERYGEIYPIMNLHIHSKKTKQFIESYKISLSIFNDDFYSEIVNYIK